MSKVFPNMFSLISFNQESFVEEALAQMEGSTLADMFDFLSKELIRLQVRNFCDKVWIHSTTSCLVLSIKAFGRKCFIRCQTSFKALWKEFLLACLFL